MMSITNKTSQQINEIHPSNGKITLKEMFEVVMEQMRKIVESHITVLDSVQLCLKTADEHDTNEDILIYSKENIWSEVQTVVCTLKIRVGLLITDDYLSDQTSLVSILGHWSFDCK